MMLSERSRASSAWQALANAELPAREIEPGRDEDHRAFTNTPVPMMLAKITDAVGISVKARTS